MRLHDAGPTDASTCSVGRLRPFAPEVSTSRVPSLGQNNFKNPIATVQTVRPAAIHSYRRFIMLPFADCLDRKGQDCTLQVFVLRHQFAIHKEESSTASALKMQIINNKAQIRVVHCITRELTMAMWKSLNERPCNVGVRHSTRVATCQAFGSSLRSNNMDG